MPTSTVLRDEGFKLDTALVESEENFRLRVADEQADVDNQLEDLAIVIDQCKAKGVQTIIEIGEHLNAAHDLLAGRGREGRFRSWVQERCHFTPRTAYNYLNVHRRFNKCESLSHFDAEALYLLSRETTAQEVRDQAIELSGQGEHVTPTRVRKLLADDRPEEPKACTELAPGIPDANHWRTEAFAMSTANVAITQLAQIKRSNLAWGKAFTKVENWIQKERQKREKAGKR